MNPYVHLGGTVRAVSPEQTLQRLRGLLPWFGITRLARITGLDTIGIPVSVAVRPTSRLLSTSQGKGITPALADVSALMESIETWHAEHLQPPELVASARSLCSRNDVLSLEETKRPSFVHKPVGADDPIGWQVAEELMSGKRWLLPDGLFRLDTLDPRGRDNVSFRVTTTGLASGNTRAEAILHGLLEVIERDAHYHLNKLPPDGRRARRVDLESIESAHNRELIDRIEAAGVTLEVVEMTGRVPVPAFHATLLEHGALTRFFIDEGMGAHMVPEIALSRAITEAAQSRAAYISGSRDDLYPMTYAREQARAAFGALEPDPIPPTRRFEDAPAPGLAETLEATVEALLALLKTCGVTRVFCCEHTRPELGVHVVHVLCPELTDIAGTEEH